MKRDELRHVVRASAEIAGDEIVVIGAKHQSEQSTTRRLS